MLFYLLAYIGGREYQNANNLFPIPGEKAQQFQSRKRVAVYHNLCKNIVNQYTSKIFHKPPTRIGLDDIISTITYLDPINRNIDINTFWKLFLRYIIVQGECFILISSPERTILEENSNISENVNLSGRIQSQTEYNSKIIQSTSVPCLELHPNGRIKHIVIEHVNGYSCIDEQVIREYVFKDRTNKLYITLESEIQNDFGIVPVVHGLIDFSGDEYGESIIGDIAVANRLHYNLKSVMASDYMTNGINILTIPMNDQLIERYPDWGYIKDGNFDLAGKDMLPVDPAAKPGYLVKDLTYHEQIRRECELLEAAMNEMANKTVRRLLAESGLSKSYDYNNENVSLEGISILINAIEIGYWQMFLSMTRNQDLKNINANIIYNRNFDMIKNQDKISNQTQAISYLDDYSEAKHTISKILFTSVTSEDLLPDEVEAQLSIMDTEYSAMSKEKENMDKNNIDNTLGNI